MKRLVSLLVLLVTGCASAQLTECDREIASIQAYCITEIYAQGCARNPELDCPVLLRQCDAMIDGACHAGP